jgi:hypothetical protein
MASAASDARWPRSTAPARRASGARIAAAPEAAACRTSPATGLFGGFGDDCFAAYHEAAPLAPGWAERVPLHQLAPLVVHALKVGGGYVAATQGALDALR